MITKYEAYYNNIRERLEGIQQEQDYPNLSLAFGHWFLEVHLNLNPQEIAESLVDGGGDNGIDAIVLKEGDTPEKNELTIFQFKFPESSSKLNKEIVQADILKTLHGFNILMGQSDDSKSNKKFQSHREILQDKLVYNFKLMFVSFNKGIVDNIDTIHSFTRKFEEETGNKLKFEDINKNGVSNLYEKMNRKNSVEVSVGYKFMQQAYRVHEIDSYIGVMNAQNLIDSIKEKLLVIFDENIRLFEPDSDVNEGIKKTASSDEADMFYFYNNGIVFICDEVNNSPNSLTVSLRGASIVNGCQTVTSLAKLHEDGNLNEDVSVLVRIIKINDYDQRSRITEYLNSQTPIKDSYFISNHTIVRDLQTSLLEDGYYLERQINETIYKKDLGESIPENLKVIKLEDTIQYYTGYWLDNLAPVAKRGKGALFNKTQIEDVLKDINSQKVKEAYEMYQEISRVITLYRKMRRNNTNHEFAEFLGIDSADLDANSEEYLFINTADILLLNATKNLKKKYETLKISFDTSKLIKDAINISKEIIKNSELKQTPATSTKHVSIFTAVREEIKKVN